MRKQVLIILTIIISVVCLYGIKEVLKGLYLPRNESKKKTDEVSQKLVEDDKKCNDKLYGILIGMRYSHPEVYEVLTEIARVKDIHSCEEYVHFIESRVEGNTQK